MGRVRKQPAPPFPEQELEQPGKESELEPRPRYEAPEYRGADKLRGLAALITGGDSGIGRSVAVLFAREGADVAITYLPEERSDAEETLQAVEREGRRALRHARPHCSGSVPDRGPSATAAPPYLSARTMSPV